MKRFFIIFSILIIMPPVYGQTTLVWSKEYTASLSQYYSESPRIQALADTIQVIGRINTADGQRLSIVKYNLKGDTISTIMYGKDSVSHNSIIDYQFDKANHVYILNKEYLGFYKSKIVLQKYSSDGTLIWLEQIQHFADTSYTPYSLALINDTGVFFTGYKEYNYPIPGSDVIFTTTLSQLYAYSASGNPLWKRDFNPKTEIKYFAHDIFVYNNILYLFAENYTFFNPLVKVDLNNNLSIHTNTGLEYGINDVQLTPDHNLLITARIRPRITKINLNGSLIWTRQFISNLPPNHTGDEMVSTIQDSVGNIYITGRHYGLNLGTPKYTNADILTLKYDKNGSLIWHNRYEYLVDNADIGNTIVLKNGQLYVGGQSQNMGIETGYDYVVIKIDSATGVTNGVYRYNGTTNGDDAISSVFVFDNGNVALTGLSYTNGQYDWTTQLLSGVRLKDKTIGRENQIQVYPNPAISGKQITIVGNELKTYSIFSTTGQVVQQGQFKINGIQSIRLDNFSTGIYLFFLTTDNGIFATKIVVR